MRLRTPVDQAYPPVIMKPNKSRWIILSQLFFLFCTHSSEAIEVFGKRTSGIFSSFKQINEGGTPESSNGTLWNDGDHRDFSQIHYFAIENTFAIDLEVDAITTTRPGAFGVNSTLGVIKPGERGDYQMTFQPDAAGVINADVTIQFSGNGATETFVYSIVGTGVGPDVLVRRDRIGSILAIEDGDDDPNEFKGSDLGSVYISSGVTKKDFFIRNTGGDDLSIPIASVQATGAGLGVSISATDLTTIVIAPGEEHPFSLTFDPSAEGVVNGQFSFGCDAPFPRNFYSFAIRGNGVIAGKPRIVILGGNPPVELAPDASQPPSAALGTVFPDTFPRATSERTFTIRNEGGGDLTFPQRADVGAPFDIVGDFDTSTPIFPSQSRTFTVSYKPTEPAAFANANVRVVSNDPDLPQVFFRVSGLSTAPTEPPSLEVTGDPNFGNVIEFSPSAPRDFYVQNTGSEPVKITSISNPSADAYFITGFESSTLQPDEALSFQAKLNSENISGGRRYTTTVSITVAEPKFAPLTLDLVATVLEDTSTPPKILAVDLQGNQLVLNVDPGGGLYDLQFSSDLETWTTDPSTSGLAGAEVSIPAFASRLYLRLARSTSN